MKIDLIKINKIHKNIKQSNYLKFFLKNCLKNYFYNKQIIIVNIYLFKYNTALLNQKTISKARNRCILTGRSRSVYRLFKLSRIKIREYVSNGYFVGIGKTS
jgi:ribosomal protein S14